MNLEKPIKTGVVFTCAHTKPEVSNERFDWLGSFLYDLKPDIVIDLGDGADMASLSSYEDRYPKAVVAQSYEADINTYNDAQERLRHKFRQNKRKRPYWIGFEGNHEHRIEKAIAYDPRLEGQNYGISFGHLQTKHWFDQYHKYEHGGPAIADYGGVSFAHYFTSGNSSSAVSGIHHAHALLRNRHHSSVCGHSHKRGIHFDDGAHPQGIIGMVSGCFKGAKEHWAGQSNNSWWSGVVVMNEWADGMFEPEFISLDRLRREYGT